MIGISASLLILRAMVRKETGQKIKEFEMHTNFKTNTMDFVLYNYKEKNGTITEKKKINFPDGKNYVAAMRAKANSLLKQDRTIDGCEPDLIVLSCMEKENFARIYFEKNGEKLSIKKPL